jgi:hypothetical protein
MLATILKSPRAAQMTIAIVETFAKIRDLSRSIAQLSDAQDKDEQKSLMQKSGEILADVLDNDLEVSGEETTIEINFAIMKIKHTVKRNKQTPYPANSTLSETLPECCRNISRNFAILNYGIQPFFTLPL